MAANRRNFSTRATVAAPSRKWSTAEISTSKKSKKPANLRGFSNRKERFTNLLEELSTAFARTPYNGISEQIETWLQRIGLSLGLDRSVMAEFIPQRGFQVVHQWTREGFPPMPLLLGEEVIPWISGKVLSGETFVAHSLSSLPLEAVRDRNFWRNSPLAPKAAVLTPLITDGEVIGAITFGDCKENRRWTPQQVRRFKLVANIFGSALARQRAAVALISFREQVAHASRATLMGETAASIAHELNNPLGAILANAEAAQAILEDEPLDRNQIREIVNDIITAERRASDYIDKVRSVFRNHEIRSESLEVSSLVQSVIEILQGVLVSKSITLQTELDPSVPKIYADKVGIEQVILNLLRNSIDAVSDAASKEINLQVLRVDEASAAISVADSGPGIPESIRHAIFEPLFTTKAHGMGMGLAIVKSIVNSQGGRITVDPVNEKGAIIRFTVPIARS